MRYAVEAWAPEYGAPMEGDELSPSGAPVELGVEVPPAEWAPRRPPPGTTEPAVVLFTDGVRRIDARVWIDGADGQTHLGVCASYAAGVVRCDGAAKVVACEVQRGLFTCAPDVEPIVTRHATFPPRAAAVDTYGELALAVQQRMGELEVTLGHRAGEADLLVVDGPLTGRQDIPHAVGYVKTHRVAYLPPPVDAVVGELAAGERTPLFLTTTRWSRFSGYRRLPGAAGHRWAGIVRCEVSADVPVAEAVATADRVSLTLPRYASQAHKDPRAPQNLHPIAGLERELRRRLGDPALLYRSLRAAAGAAA